LEQITAQEPICGDPEWYLKRRNAYPLSPPIKPAGGVALPRKLLTGKKLDTLLSMVPPEAPLFPGGPQEVGQPDSRRLRRFSGRKAIALNSTFIFGIDDRRTYRDRNIPWVWIGQLSTPRGRGTAALVGRNTILTASHVMTGFWSGGEPLRAAITFVPAMFNGTSVLGSDWTVNVTGVAAWEQTEADETVGYDMAVCQLDKPLGEWLGYFGASTYDDGDEDRHVWSHVGYPWDLSPNGDWPCYQKGIAVRDDDSDSFGTLEVETDADIASGHSGGPLWGLYDGDRRIIGTLSGHEDKFLDNNNSLFAGGNGLVRLVKWARDNWGG
jgi:V8-like Glu-specific endopeptidase